MTYPRARSLDLSGRDIASVPPKVWRGASLQVLNLYRNKFKSLPAEIAQLKELRVLIVANNQLRALPEAIGFLPRLRMLDAGHNLIASLAQSFAKLTSLSDYLYLHDNRLQVLSDYVFEDFGKLRYLNLGDNPLRGLPSSIGALANLEELRLENIGLDALPDFIAKLTTLDELAVRNNRLSSLSHSFEKLRNLRHLDLRGNRFTRAPGLAEGTEGLWLPCASLMQPHMELTTTVSNGSFWRSSCWARSRVLTRNFDSRATNTRRGRFSLAQSLQVHAVIGIR
jgi:Leucine-rich repeat (LRR) protein